MSFGPWAVPHTNIPSISVDTGCIFGCFSLTNLSSVKGTTLPFKFNTLLKASTPSDKLPVISEDAVRSKLPTVCPSKSLVVLKR